MLVSAVAESMSIADSDIKIQLYDANVDDNYKDDWQQVKNTDTASGKVMLTYNNDIFNDGNRAAYQVWGGALVDGVKQANSAITEAMMQVSCDFSVHHHSTFICNRRTNEICS